MKTTAVKTGSFVKFRRESMVSWFWITGWIITVTSLLGNGFTIYLITTRRRLFTLPSWFILSLAVADFLFVLCYFPASFFCNVLFHSCNREYRIVVASLFMYASVTNLVVMTIDRFIAIALPLRYVVLVTSRRVLAAIFSAWIFSSILAPIQYQVERADSKILHVVFEITRLATVEVTPAVILIISTIRMLLIRRKHMRQAAIQVSQLLHNKWRDSPDCQIFKLSRRRELSSVQVICVVVSVFIACYTVNISVSFCIGLEICNPPREVRDLLAILLMVNSLINPFAYAFLKNDIKKECEALFRRKFKTSK